MPNDVTRLLATVSALGISLGVGFGPALAAPEAVEAATAAKGNHHKKAQLHVRKAGGEQESVHKKVHDIPSFELGAERSKPVSGAPTVAAPDTPPK